jgi:hypothetical protein
MFAADLSVGIVPVAAVFVLAFGGDYAWRKYRGKSDASDGASYPQSHVHVRHVPYDWEEDMDAQWNRGV